MRGDNGSDSVKQFFETRGVRDTKAPFPIFFLPFAMKRDFLIKNKYISIPNEEK